ncbi:cysteine proteinase [Hypoxylon sp. FL1857]|nr:cysteine proteinase [Hypoxylon sp. FL1857]
MFFDIIADTVEDTADLAAQAIGVAHRTQNGILDSIGANDILPTPMKNLSDNICNTNESFVRETGQTTATLLRGFDNTSERSNDEEEDTEPDENPGACPDDRGPYPSPHDPCDHIYKPDDNKSKPEDLSLHVDLRNGCPEVYDQGHMMSCTAHAVAAAFEFDVIKQRLPAFSPSRLFIWYNARAMSGHRPLTKKGISGDVKKNVGSNIRDAIKSLNFKQYGVCSEDDWPYEEGKTNKKHVFDSDARAGQRPCTLAREHAHQHTAPRYKKIEEGDRDALIKCLNEGYLFVFGMRTYGLLSRGRIGSNGYGLERPKAEEMKDEHRHSLLAVGYKQDEEVFIVRNSWGANWGQGGYFYMPYHYLKHCYDFWTIRVVNSPPKQP